MKSVREILSGEIPYAQKAQEAAIKKAEQWLEKNYDRLFSEGNGDIAEEALRRYEKLCDEYRENYASGT